MSDFGNFRTPLPDSSISGNNLIRTPYGNVPTSSSSAPVGPPPLPNSIQPMGMNNYYGNSMGMGGMGMYNSPYSNYGSSYGSSYGMMGMGGGYGGFNSGGYGYNRFGGNAMMNSPENMFVQLAEERSRPAFQSIESLVSAISNIALMLDSTFFAITNTFRAILGVAANFGRLRGVFAQFWHTYAIFRGLNWVYRKILYWLRVSNIDPSSAQFQRAFAAAANGESVSEIQKKSGGTSAWPIITFLGFIFTAPFLITRLMGTVQKTALEECEYFFLSLLFCIFEIRFAIVGVKLTESFAVSH
ncbi:PEX13 family protein [Megaselia abdita]